MNILACETSTTLGSVAVFSHGQVFTKQLERAGSHSESLNLMIQNCLQQAQLTLSDIDVFASGIGPGSFTGVRVSLNTIKTLSYIENKKCAGIDTLINIAILNYQLNQHLNKQVTVLLNAYKNMVYFAEFAFSEEFKTESSSKLKWTIVHPPQVVRVQELKNIFNFDSLVVGDGYLAYSEYFKKNLLDQPMIRNIQNIDFPQASTICKIISESVPTSSFIHYSELMPLYLRDSEAEENLKGIKYIPL
jgi:tRNA threonylcarbamoyladenosine biosynthesis protein TsaB